MTRKEKILKDFASKGMPGIIESCLTKEELAKAQSIWIKRETISRFEAVFEMLAEMEDAFSYAGKS